MCDMEHIFTCTMCSAASHLKFHVSEYIKHLKIFHAHQPDLKIICGIGGCQRNYTNLGTFQNHIYGVHSDVSCSIAEESIAMNNTELDSESDCGDSVNSDTGHDEPYCEDNIETDSNQQCSSQSSIQKSSALFLLGIKEKFKLTQSSVNGIVQGVTAMNQHHISILKSQIYATLSNANVSLSQLHGLDEYFKHCENPFLGLETQYQQIQYFRQNFNLIEPVRVTLGNRHVWKSCGAKRRCVSKEDSVMYIPILQTLQCLLTNEAVLLEIEHGHKSSSGLLHDFCDGEAFTTHPLFSVKVDTLQIFFYFDELEVCNPLGSKVKIHKLGSFYFTLGNLSPKYRSRLSTIQLVALTKSSFISSYGMDAVLKPFIDDMKKLEQGVEMMVRGTSRIVYGALGIVSADNLGSLALGGFKESCSALRMCRYCMSTKGELQKQFLERYFKLRNEADHVNQCSLIESDEAGSTSKEYGINRNSILNDLHYFHVCNGSLIPDIMHDVLEGALQYEVKLMLQFMINREGYFTLEIFNSHLVNLELGYMESNNRPTVVSIKTLNSEGNSLKQNASQMWLLGRILPLIIGEYVPENDERWRLYLNMMNIVDILFAPNTTTDHATYLATLIDDHHHDFCELYPQSSIIPKMHFMVHMPRMMIKFGPLIRHWTMRYEAKHSYFKQLANSMGNFINIPYSLAMRHQLYQCYLHTNTRELPGWTHNIETGPGSVVPHDFLMENLEYHISSAFKCKWVKINGDEYKLSTCIILDAIHDLPIVGVVLDIYIVNGNEVVFQVDQFFTSFEPHYRVYILDDHVSSSDPVLHSNLFIQTPVHMRKSNIPELKNSFILLPFALYTE